MKKANILLLNPPIYDFTAYDFWLKPFGLLKIAGQIQNQANLFFFDFLDRENQFYQDPKLKLRSDEFGRGEYYSEIIPKPEILSFIPRHYRRFGLPQKIFIDFITAFPKIDFVLIQTSMTYWYLGLEEVIKTLRQYQPQAKIILGGVYATLCTDHAQKLKPDLIITNQNQADLWAYLKITPKKNWLPLWDLYPKIKYGILKITDGCANKCSYCSTPIIYPKFQNQTLSKTLAEYNQLSQLGVTDIAFYDDALLHKADNILLPFLKAIIKNKNTIRFHTPNAIHARLVTSEIAENLAQAKFIKISLGFESTNTSWHQKTGQKVTSQNLIAAVKNLTSAGLIAQNISANVMLAHPDDQLEKTVETIKFVHALGIKIFLSEFSPIPLTPDLKKYPVQANASSPSNEPLLQNKSVYPALQYGYSQIQAIKQFTQQLNSKLK
jgi:sulfatase maturation enzyme AslB (radical SAM superfamily)